MSNQPWSKGHVPETLTAALLAPPEQRDAAFRAIALEGRSRLASPRLGVLPWPASARGLTPFPADDSAQTAAELVELATLLTRLPHTPFRWIRGVLHSLGNPLDGLSETLLGPTRPSSAFRPEEQTTPEPYISQLLLLPVPMGAMKAEQLYTLRAGAYGTTPETRAAMLRGSPTETQRYGPALYIHTPRALASAMHQDPPYLMGLHALLILQSLGVRPSSLFPPLPAEAGFTTYGGAAFTQCLLAEASYRAFHDCWIVKYNPDPQQRRARPEELLATPERLHPLWHERGAPLLSEWNGHLPLPIAEGAPSHTAYVSGHAATAAAEAVVLMACIADSPWPGVPLQASPDGTALIPTSTTALTIHREIRKWAWNKSFGRVALGVHYRSDITAGLMLGQAAAVDLLRQVKAHDIEPWGTTAFVGFDGKVVII
jgi:membrane-associated phospholipid phosphatase